MEHNTVGRFYNSLTKFKVYEDYLDSKVTPLDLFYLQVSSLINFSLFKSINSQVCFVCNILSEPSISNFSTHQFVFI